MVLSLAVMILREVLSAAIDSINVHCLELHEFSSALRGKKKDKMRHTYPNKFAVTEYVWRQPS